MSLDIARECGAKVKAYASGDEVSFRPSELTAYTERIRADERKEIECYGNCHYWCPACLDAISNPKHPSIRSSEEGERT